MKKLGSAIIFMLLGAALALFLPGGWNPSTPAPLAPATVVGFEIPSCFDELGNKRALLSADVATINPAGYILIEGYKMEYFGPDQSVTNTVTAPWALYDPETQKTILLDERP